MKLGNVYKTVLNESQAQSCIVKFGRKLFGKELDNDEENTDIEDEYLDYIMQFMSSNDKTPRPEFIAAMKTLKGCMSEFPDILEPSGMAYKESEISIAELKLQYNDIKDDLDDNGDFTFNYKADVLVQTWCDSKEDAKGLASPNPALNQVLKGHKAVEDDPQALAEFIKNLPDLKKIMVPIVIKYQTNSDDFLFNAKDLTKLVKNDVKELLRISNQSISVHAEIIDMKPVYNLLSDLK